MSADLRRVKFGPPWWAFESLEGHRLHACFSLWVRRNAHRAREDWERYVCIHKELA